MTPDAHRARHTSGHHDAPGHLCVLASGSRGNCSVLVVPDGGTRRVVLIDAGLSPRRTVQLLRLQGIEPWEVDAIVFTHLDADHAHLGWASSASLHAPFYIHASHRGRAERSGLLSHPTHLVRDAFTIADRVRIEPVLLEHDSLGVMVLRIELPPDAQETRPATLGFATDVGRPSGPLIEHLHGCDVLAIESNYCPAMQQSSPRPEFLKRRIMGGSGHLSNQQCLDLVRRIQPRRSVVCLHLSQQCNDPALVHVLHRDEPYELVVTSQHQPSPWIALEAAGGPRVMRATSRRPDLHLWSSVSEA